jgi:lipid-A-disaccharide synthase
MRPLKVMLVALEPSGDALGAGLAAALKAKLGVDGVALLGIGGARMVAEGIASPFDIGELSLVGVVEVVGAIPRALRRIEDIVRLAAAEKPDIAVLIDSWVFNHFVAGGLRRRAPRTAIVKYVAPQVWATRPWRAGALARRADHLMTLFGFEPPYFTAKGLPTTCVGSPALLDYGGAADLPAFRQRIGAGPDDAILLVLPGSRPSEIEHVMPSFEDAAMRLADARPGLHLIVPTTPTVAEQVKARVAGWRHRATVIETEADKRAAMRAATVALTKSGTVTTELAVAGCPMVVGYRAQPLTAAIGLAMAQVKYLTLVNIAAGEAVAPEFIQDRCTAAALAAAVGALLDDPARRAAQVEAQNTALARLSAGVADPFGAAADVVIKVATDRGWRG